MNVLRFIFHVHLPLFFHDLTWHIFRRVILQKCPNNQIFKGWETNEAHIFETFKFSEVLYNMNQDQ